MGNTELQVRIMSQKKKKKKVNSKVIIAEAVVVAALALGGWGYFTWKNAQEYVNEQDAVQINGEQYSLSDVNYFFYTYYDTFRQQNEEYLSYMIDDSKPLKEQEYEDGETWFDYLLNESVDSMVQVVTVAEAAEKEGFALDEQSQTEIEEYLDGVTAVAENNDLSADQYMAGIYGRDMSLSRYEELMKMSFMAREYSLYKQEELEFSEEDLEKEFEENKEQYEFVSYERLYFKAADKDEEVSEPQMKEAKAQAEDALERVQSGEDLKELSDEYEGTVYYESDEAYYSSGYAYGDWLFSEKRSSGDSAVLEDEKGYYVMVFRDRFRHEYPGVTIRDISFPVNLTAENLDKEYEDSCADAEAVLEEWKSGEKTEEQFEKLYEKFSSSEENDGLYENVLKDQMDSYVDRWSFDEARKPGDCEVIYADDGFHVLYFVGFGEPAWKIEEEKNLREEALQNMLESMLDEVEVKRSEEALQRAASTLNE